MTSPTATVAASSRSRQARAAAPLILLGVALPAAIFGLLAWQMAAGHDPTLDAMRGQPGMAGDPSMRPSVAVHVWWLLSRATALGALLLLSGSLGLALLVSVSGRQTRPSIRPTLLALHNWASLVGLALIFTHAVTLVGDPFMQTTLAQAFVPFTASWQQPEFNMGIFAFYLGLLLGPTYYVHRRVPGPRWWRRLHYGAALVYILSIPHTLRIGSDFAAPDVTPLWQAILWLIQIPIVVLLALRLGDLWRRRWSGPGGAAPGHVSGRAT